MFVNNASICVALTKLGNEFFLKVRFDKFIQNVQVSTNILLDEIAVFFNVPRVGTDMGDPNS